METGAAGASNDPAAQEPLAELEGLVNEDGTVAVIADGTLYPSVPRAVADFMMKERERARLFQSRMHDREDWVSQFCKAVAPDRDAHFLPDVVMAAVRQRSTSERILSRISSAQKEATNGQ